LGQDGQRVVQRALTRSLRGPPTDRPVPAR
jgi:hypothetical protein